MIINVVRKPLVKNVCENITLHNTGGINIDQTRIQFETDGKRKETKRTPREDRGVWTDNNSGMKKEKSLYADADPKGRFPANVLLSESTVEPMNDQSGVLRARGNKGCSKGGGGLYGHKETVNNFGFGDDGGASRFFKLVKEDE